MELPLRNTLRLSFLEVVLHYVVCLSRITEGEMEGRRESDGGRAGWDGLGQTDQRWPSFPAARDSTELFCLAACGFGHHGPDMLFFQKRMNCNRINTWGAFIFLLLICFGVFFFGGAERMEGIFLSLRRQFAPCCPPLCWKCKITGPNGRLGQSETSVKSLIYYLLLLPSVLVRHGAAQSDARLVK